MPSARENYDLIVVGLGAMGSAALFHAAEAGLRVLGIDRHNPPHEMGSTHAETRITRLAIGEGPQYLPFVARSHEIWNQLADRTGTRLLYQPGGYVITPTSSTEGERWGDFVTKSAAVADEAGVEFFVRSPEELSSHVPNVHLKGGELLGFEPTGGVVLCERAVEIQLALAKAAGAQIRTNATVTSINTAGDGASVTVGTDVHNASRVIVCTGAWFGDLAPACLTEKTSVTRQVVYWFEVEDPAPFSVARFPFFIWSGKTIEEYVAIFPMVPGGVNGLKILGEQFSVETHPEAVDRVVSDNEISEFYARYVTDRLTGVTPHCVKAAVCLYTNTPDDHFLIDTHPESDRILYASPCSGHGFKHSTALGEAMVQQAMDGGSGLDLAPFSRSRFDEASPSR